MGYRCRRGLRSRFRGMSDGGEFEAALEGVLVRAVPGVRRLVQAERLSGGASQETYRLSVETDSGAEILAMRREAEEKLGMAFDLRTFHDVVLESGALPLPLLRERVERWVREGI